MKPELLSPAGSPEALQAAIALGADAVYLGARAHGARASAGFDDEALKNAINLAHLYGKRVYVTVNTLLKQTELDGARQVIKTLVDFRSDAVIVQDLGLVRLIHEEFPTLQVHGSTQMSVHNAEGAEVLLKMGVSRVVLARECAMEDIREVVKTGIETEVFVHGAMCVSVSGQCLFSSQIGGRSGNRGKCAQPCRLQYSYKGTKGALLSMHDMNTLENIKDFLDAGVTGFKIEGRLKRAEYVAVVTGAYRRALDEALTSKTAPDFKAEQAALTQIFSRGFTKGHAFSDQDSLLIGAARVSHLGIKLGSILSSQQRDGFVLAQAKMSGSLNNEDGLQIRGRTEQDLIYSGPAVERGGIATLRLRQRPENGDEIYRLQDEKQLKKAREDAALLPLLPFEAKLTLLPGQPAALEVRHGETEVQVTGELAQAAEKQPLSEETLARLLGKTGGTPFALSSLSLTCPSPVFMPSSAINALRREALTKLSDAVIAAHRLPLALPYLKPAQSPRRLPEKPLLYALVDGKVNREALLASGADRLIVSLTNYRSGRLEEALDDLRPEDLLLLPRQMTDRDLKRVMELAEKRKLKLMADNIGQIGKASVDSCGEGIPVWNDETQKMLLDFGVRSAVLSRELSLDEIKALSPNLLELILPVYGRPLLMLLNHCPERVTRGLSKNKAGCTFCERGHGVLGQTLRDRMDADYPLLPTHFDHGCLISLFHHKATNLGPLAMKMSWLMDLRLEDESEALALTAWYKALLTGQKAEEVRPVEPGRALLGVE